MSLTKRLANLRFRTRYLGSHPAFAHDPIGVVLREATWVVVRALGRDVMIPIHRRSKMRLTPPKSAHDHAGLVYVFREMYEPAVLHAVDEFVKDGYLVYDIGANIGLWTLRMAENSGGEGRVTSFEPVPFTADRLELNVELSGFKNVTVVRSSLGDSEGVVSIHVPKGHAGRASLAPEAESDTEYEVPIARLDSVWTDQGRPKIAFMKVDIEGSEPLMLAGALEMIRCSYPVVAMEVNPVKLGRLGFDVDALFAPLIGLGYATYRWNQASKRFERDDSRNEGDVLFLPPAQPTPRG